MRKRLNCVKMFGCFVLFSLTCACQSQLDRELDSIKNQLDLVDNDINHCSDLQMQVDKSDGAVALAEADVSIGKNTDSISQQEEDDYRADAFHRSGVLPSQANGWKDELKGQGEMAKSQLRSLQADVDSKRAAYLQSCQNLDQMRKQKSDLEAQRDKLSQVN